jgi:hypothetical protein
MEFLKEKMSAALKYINGTWHGLSKETGKYLSESHNYAMYRQYYKTNNTQHGNMLILNPIPSTHMETK